MDKLGKILSALNFIWTGRSTVAFLTGRFGKRVTINTPITTFKAIKKAPLNLMNEALIY